MTDRSLGQDLPADWHRARSAARDPHFYTADLFRAATATANGPASANGTTSASGTVSASGTASSDGPASVNGTTSANGTVRHAQRDRDADTTGFLEALFDFGFTSFVTPKIIKVLYVLVTIGTIVTALAFTIVVFKASVAFGIVALVFGDPLVILVVMAAFRIFVEFFVVIFRAAEDIRALREGGGTG
ncbi:MAG TPA: DUF4282 domain-containing protein [Streptosporangiaceae bacterium]